MFQPKITIHSYEIYPNQIRKSIIVTFSSTNYGEIAPLPFRSHETLEEALEQIGQLLLYEPSLPSTSLFPSVEFGLESALYPRHPIHLPFSALLMGSPSEILTQATLRKNEGFTSAKLKVSHLSMEEAFTLINQLKDSLFLRIDVNRAWETEDTLRFFSNFKQDAFDYIEEPFKNPSDLKYFTHPLAIDESFPNDLTLPDLEMLPTLKALIYKPTIQGGYFKAKPLLDWAQSRNLSFILSSSFESEIGLHQIGMLAHKLNIQNSIPGLGTFHFLKNPNLLHNTYHLLHKSLPRYKS